MKIFHPLRRARTPKPGRSSSKTMISVFGGMGAMAPMVSRVSFTGRRRSGEKGAAAGYTQPTSSLSQSRTIRCTTKVCTVPDGSDARLASRRDANAPTPDWPRLDYPPRRGFSSSPVLRLFRKPVVLEHQFFPRTCPRFAGFLSPCFRRVFGTGSFRPEAGRTLRTPRTSDRSFTKLV